MPNEFEAVGSDFVTLVGIGEDFVVLHDWESANLWVGRSVE